MKHHEAVTLVSVVSPNTWAPGRTKMHVSESDLQGTKHRDPHTPGEKNAVLFSVNKNKTLTFQLYKSSTWEK